MIKKWNGKATFLALLFFLVIVLSFAQSYLFVQHTIDGYIIVISDNQKVPLISVDALKTKTAKKQAKSCILRGAEEEIFFDIIQETKS
jgi:hypothetical protein